MQAIRIIPALLALAAPAAVADITVPAPPAATPAGNCDLLAANTVRAVLKDVRDITTQTLEQDQPVTTKVAVFEVVENLAYKKYVRYGDGRLEPGARFTVELRKDIPGQPAGVADEIAQMKQGEEAVLKMDHLYMLNAQGGNDPVRACSRIARSNGESPVQPAQQPAEGDSPAPQQPADASVPTTAAPLGSGGGRVPVLPPDDDENDPLGMGAGMGAVVNSLLQGGMPGGSGGSSFQISFGGGNGGNVQSTQVMQQYDSRTGKMVKRMFINGVEVDPETRQPLQPAQPAQAQPDDKGQTSPDSDTILETPKPDAAPESDKPAISAEDSF